jgi:chromosome segregation ATPase
LQQKDTEMRDLMYRLQEASAESGESHEMVMLRERLNQMENHAIENADRVTEMERQYQTSQEELRSTRGKLATFEGTVAKLEGQLLVQEENTRNATDQEGLVSELENKLQGKARTIASLTSEKAALSNEIGTLKSLLEKQQGEIRNKSVEEQKRSSDDIEILRGQLNSLQKQLEMSSTEHHGREESLQNEMKSYQRKLASKDGEIMMMKRKVETANEGLQESRRQLQASQEVIERMSSEMEVLKAKQNDLHNGRSSTAAKLLQQSKENADDVDNLRSTVISLAAALETSESRRADAIDRLLKERETHGESLRRLADSVKRFYATMSCSDT